LVTGISLMDNQVQVSINNLPLDYGMVRDLFHKAADLELNVDMISIIASDGALHVSFTIIEDKKKAIDAAIKTALSELEGYSIEYNKGYAKVSVVGIGMKTGTGVAYKFFDALKDMPIKLVTTSEIKISCLIADEYKKQAVEKLAEVFNLTDSE